MKQVPQEFYQSSCLHGKRRNNTSKFLPFSHNPPLAVCHSKWSPIQQNPNWHCSQNCRNKTNRKQGTTSAQAGLFRSTQKTVLCSFNLFNSKLWSDPAAKHPSIPISMNNTYFGLPAKVRLHHSTNPNMSHTLSFSSKFTKSHRSSTTIPHHPLAWEWHLLGSTTLICNAPFPQIFSWWSGWTQAWHHKHLLPWPL